MGQLIGTSNMTAMYVVQVTRGQSSAIHQNKKWSGKRGGESVEVTLFGRKIICEVSDDLKY